VIGNTTVEEFLAHNGVKGMKWGVVKSEQTSTTPRSGKAMDLKPNADGSIDIPKGATIQRMMNPGKSLFSKGGTDFGNGVTYAAFTKGDRLRYEDAFGFTKNLFITESAQVLTMTAQTALKSPTPGKTSSAYYDSLKSNPEHMKAAKNALKRSQFFSEKGWQKLLDDPESKDAYSTFSTLYDKANYDPKLKVVNESFHDKLKKSGFNMLLDPSDSTFGGIYDAPIVVLDGEKNLKVTGRVVVDKASKKRVAEELRDYQKIDTGKTLMQRLGYSVFE
jgi:hypothetical protein